MWLRKVRSKKTGAPKTFPSVRYRTETNCDATRSASSAFASEHPRTICKNPQHTRHQPYQHITLLGPRKRPGLLRTKNCKDPPIYIFLCVVEDAFRRRRQIPPQWWLACRMRWGVNCDSPRWRISWPSSAMDRMRQQSRTQCLAGLAQPATREGKLALRRVSADARMHEVPVDQLNTSLCLIRMRSLAAQGYRTLPESPARGGRGRCDEIRQPHRTAGK